MCVCVSLCISVLLFAAAGYERDQILNSLQRFVCFYFTFFLNIYALVHIYTFSLFFFVRFQSSFSSLTLLDHVVLVSSASTTNTREIKNSFFVRAVHRRARLQKCGGNALKKLSKRNEKQYLWIFFCFVYVYDIVMIFVSIFCLLSFDKYTKNY